MPTTGPSADPTLLLSVNEFVGDGSKTSWNVSFAGGYLSRSHVYVTLTVDSGAIEDVPFTWIDAATISITPAIAEGQKFRVYRSTPRELPLLDFADGAFLTEKNLDVNAKQAVFIAAEAFDRAVFATKGDPGTTDAAGVFIKRAGDYTAERTVGERGAELPSLYDWDGMGGDDTIRLQRALDGVAGGRLLIPAGSVRTSGIVDIRHAGTTLLLDANATIYANIGRLGVDFSQENFGNAIRVLADDVSIIGQGPSSRIQNTGGSDGNAVGWLFGLRGLIADLTLDGDKDHVIPIEDDSFQSGLSCIAYRPRGEGLCSLQARGLHIQNWAQYGANIYGDLVDGLSITGCDVSNNGRSQVRGSVGAGIVVTRGCRNVTVAMNRIRANSGHGVFWASAGLPMIGSRVIHNDIFNNGRRGISVTEEKDWGVDPGNAGNSSMFIGFNRVFDNVEDGIRLGTFDAQQEPRVGPLENGKVLGNTIEGNGGYGLLMQSNDVDGKRVEDWDVQTNTVRNNSSVGIAVTGECRNVRIAGNRVSGNTGGDVVDNQDHWTPLGLQPGYDSPFGPPVAEPGFSIDDGWVEFRGAVNVSPGVMTYLPAVARPKSDYLFGVGGIDGFVSHVDGRIQITAGSGVFRLSNMQFNTNK